MNGIVNQQPQFVPFPDGANSHQVFACHPRTCHDKRMDGPTDIACADFDEARLFTTTGQFLKNRQGLSPSGCSVIIGNNERVGCLVLLAEARINQQKHGAQEDELKAGN